MIEHSPVISTPLGIQDKVKTQIVRRLSSQRRMFNLLPQEKTKIHASATSKLTLNLSKSQSKVVSVAGIPSKVENETIPMQRKVANLHVLQLLLL